MGQGGSQIAPVDVAQGQSNATVEPIVVDLPVKRPKTRRDKIGTQQPHINEASIPRKPVIMDVEHGVVCSRRPLGDDNQDRTDGSAAPRERLFYHPKSIPNRANTQVLASDGAAPEVRRVVRGPKRDVGKKLHFVISAGDNDSSFEQNRPLSTLPQGKGYQWPNSFRPAGTRCFNIVFLGEEAEEEQQLTATSSSDVNILSSDSGSTSSSGSRVRLSIRATTTAADVSAQLALHLLRPASELKLFFNKFQEPISDTTVISNLADASCGNWETILIGLVEI